MKMRQREFESKLRFLAVLGLIVVAFLVGAQSGLGPWDLVPDTPWNARAK